MSRIERLTPRPALHQKRVDLPVSANTVHCIKTAWIFRHCIIASLHHCTKTRVELPGRTNNFNDLQIVAKAKKTAWTGRYPQKRHGSFTGTHPQLLLRASCQAKRPHPQSLLPSSSSVSSTTVLRPEDIDTDNQHRAGRPGHHRRATP
jgi:hypothetical protein